MTGIQPSALPARAGLGLKPEHYRDIHELEPDVGFFEVHAENYMGAGGPPHRHLSAIAGRYPLSLHGVGLSIGGEGELDRAHLKRLRNLVERYRPHSFSEHLAWSTHDSAYLNDLLPLPYTERTLARVAAHVDEAQQAVGQRPRVGVLDVMPAMVDQMHVIHARRAGRHAGQARQAAIDVAHLLMGRRAIALEHRLDEIDAPTRRIALVAQQHESRARGRAEAAMHTLAQDLLRPRGLGIGKLDEVEVGLHGYVAVFIWLRENEIPRLRFAPLGMTE